MNKHVGFWSRDNDLIQRSTTKIQLPRIRLKKVNYISKQLTLRIENLHYFYRYTSRIKIYDFKINSNLKS